MATPTMITIAGTYLKPDGSPETGSVSFFSNTFARHGASNDVIAPGVLRATLDPAGELSLQVPASDDPAWSPVGWSYTVVLQLSGLRTQFEAVIPYDAPGGVLDLSDLLPAQPAGSELYAAYAHDHPDDITTAELAAALATRLALTGGTITGNLTVQGAFAGTSVMDVDPAANKVTVDGVLELGTAGTMKFGDAADANLYRVGADYIATDGKVAVGLDIECWSSTHGLVLHDRSNGNTYRLKVTGGVLGVEIV